MYNIYICISLQNNFEKVYEIEDQKENNLLCML